MTCFSFRLVSFIYLVWFVVSWGELWEEAEAVSCDDSDREAGQCCGDNDHGHRWVAAVVGIGFLVKRELREVVNVEA